MIIVIFFIDFLVLFNFLVVVIFKVCLFVFSVSFLVIGLDILNNLIILVFKVEMIIVFKIIVSEVNFLILLILLDIGNVIVVVVVWGSIDVIIWLLNWNVIVIR